MIKHTKHFHKTGVKVNIGIIKVSNAANRIHPNPIHLMYHINSNDINNFMKIQGWGLMSGACLGGKGSPITQKYQEK